MPYTAEAFFIILLFVLEWFCLYVLNICGKTLGKPIHFSVFVAYNEGVKEKIRLSLTLEKSRYNE